MKNVNRLITGNLNTNLKSNKFDQLKLCVQGMFDILIVAETKSDSIFPTSQFMIDGYSEPCHFDRSRNGGGVLTYILEDILRIGLVDQKLPYDIESIWMS